MAQTHPSADGMLVEIDGVACLRFQRRYGNPISEVWDAITNPERLAQWFLPFDADIFVELAPGGRYVITGRGEGEPSLSFRVLRVDPPVLFEHTHVDPRSVVTWTLSAQTTGCTLVVTQSLPDLPAAVHGNFVAGMHTSLDSLGDLLSGDPSAWDLGRMASHQRRYAAMGLAMPLEARA